MKTILDPSFRYTPSFNTDLRKTFARIRRAQRAEESTKPIAALGLRVGNVSPLARRAVGIAPGV